MKTSQKRISCYIKIAIFLFFILLAVPQAQAFHIIPIDQSTIAKGITLNIDKGNFLMGIFPNVLNDRAQFEFLKLDELMPDKEGFARVSPVYQFDLKNKEVYNQQKPLVVEIKFTSDSGAIKSLFYFDKIRGKWQILPTKNDYQRKISRAKIHLPFARVAVFETPSVLEQGRASWYAYRNCLCAASPDFPQGSELKVTNIENGKSVIVRINDYGPDRRIFPDRVIDLDKAAFSRIAQLSEGVANVQVEVSDEKATDLNSILAAKTSVPNLISDAGMVVNADTGDVLFSQNINEKLPIASITKLMFSRVFLATKPDFERTIEYSSKDNREGAAVGIGSGDQLKIKDLFYSAMVGSKNNAVMALVRSTGLTNDEFVVRMNEEAKSLGLTHTSFTEPTGLSEHNLSSAKDVASMAKETLNNLLMLQATTTKAYSFSTLKNSKHYRILNTNRLINSEYYITGAKTGYTTEAGHCLVMKVKDNGHRIIAVVLGAPDSNTRYNEMRQLINYGINKLKSTQLASIRYD